MDFLKACYFMKVGNTGLDGGIQILFSRHEYSSRQGRLSYNNELFTGPMIFLESASSA